MRELSVIEAIREALGDEMARDERVMLLGEDIGVLGGVFRATEGLFDRFGAARVVDMPMAETVIAGVTVGLAMRGMRPVAEIQFADFIHASMDHLVGEAAKIRWRTGGDWTCPMVLRTAYGGGFRGGPYHSQSVEAYYAHAPGLKVVAPSTPADAKGLLLAAIRDPDPVLVLEHKRTYRAIRGEVPDGDYIVPIGRAAIAREGTDATVLAYGMMLHESLAAAETLAGEGIDVEVVDLRTLLPLDRETIVASLAKTRRLCVVHEDTITMGLGAELCALAAEADVLDVPPVRVATPDIPGISVDDNLEDAVLPNRKIIRDALIRLVARERTRSGAVMRS
ncbi:MAG TPA: alpha-ketoacid dehydrogenase subunit beta [Candidatus Elarobacter sp.]|nr:alpha-ketoacid dehydrogenase subunit beta [Candidatus Elarobacter sp.]